MIDVKFIEDWNDKEIIVQDNEGFNHRTIEVDKIQNLIIEHAEYEDAEIIEDYGFEFWFRELHNHVVNDMNYLFDLYPNLHENFKIWE